MFFFVKFYINFEVLTNLLISYIIKLYNFIPNYMIYIYIFMLSVYVYLTNCLSDFVKFTKES